jgi:hypothetical protein
VFCTSLTAQAGGTGEVDGVRRARGREAGRAKKEGEVKKGRTKLGERRVMWETVSQRTNSIRTF